ncbi:MAG: PLD nuclease N-terminal domain-containing protein [Nocardiaceae bacterium]|nr:PLD nuclease N-terminal domain-containing protein [Nocardiaceae bacterium]
MNNLRRGLLRGPQPDVAAELRHPSDAHQFTVAAPSLAALISILRIRHDRAGSKFWWSALVIVLPLIGPAAWFLLGAPPLRRRVKLQ